jgi:hypothetical protein
VEVVEVDGVRREAVERGRERRRDRWVVELAQRRLQVPQAVRAVVDAEQPHAVLLPLGDVVGRLAGRRPS